MAKAWRNEAARKINEQRAWENTLTGKVTTPTARVQAHIKNSFPVKGAGNWLLAGLLIRAGIQGDMPSTLKKHLHEPYVPATEGFAKRLARKFRNFGKLFG